ncbi:hypothetical protein EH5_00212 [Bacillus subtilis]|nr:hypothetical protein EH5_00212 [Bacillus subtilis]
MLETPLFKYGTSILFFNAIFSAFSHHKETIIEYALMYAFS